MYAQVEKPKENKSRAVADSVAQKKSNGKKGFGFEDNRPETTRQRRLSNTIKLGDTRHVLQLMSEVEHTSGKQRYIDAMGQNKSQIMGKRMVAYLDPFDPLTGTESTAFDRYGIYTDNSYLQNGKHLTAMHLLNAHIGGLAVDENLFPQWGSYNIGHLNEVEGCVKSKLISLSLHEMTEEYGVRVYYEVEVVSPSLIKPDNVQETRFNVFGPLYIDSAGDEQSGIPQQIQGGSLNDILSEGGWDADAERIILRGNREHLASPYYEGNRNEYRECAVHPTEWNKGQVLDRRIHFHDSRGISSNGEVWDPEDNDF